MNVTKRKIWAFGITAAFAGFVLLLLNPRVDELTVHLIDEAGRPLRCAVRIEERHDLRFLSAWQFLPLELRRFERKRAFDSADGVFRVKHISKRSSSDREERICVMDIFWSEGLQCHLIYYATTNGCIIVPLYQGRYGRPVKVEAAQAEVSVELPPRIE
jgi:hypothetical protein